MSKSKGGKITIKFTEDLVGDVTGLDPKPIGVGTEFYLPTGTATASSQYSSYAPQRAFQNDSNYWYTRTIPSWIQIELSEPVYIAGFRWDTRTTSYRPRAFKVQGSNDGETWIDLYSDESPNDNDWKEFSWKPGDAFKFYRWDISSGWSSYLYIYQIQLLVAGGNESAFTVTGEEYQYVKGPMIQREYKVKSVENHPTLNKKHLLLTMEDFNNFNNVEGSLTIEYDALNGNLSGRGGAVESFEETFTPEDLVQTPDPNVEEYISVSPVEVTVELKDVSYHPGYAAEYISAAPVEVTALLQDANTVNP